METVPSRLTQEELLWFNKRYATVESEGQFLVIRLEDFTTYKPEEFKKALADKRRFVAGERQPIKLANEWLQDPKRLNYPYGFEFDPSIPPVKNHHLIKNRRTFNLWRGFATQPKEGNVQPYLDFVREVVCAGDNNVYRWLMSWQANLLQDPANKPGTAIVLRGEQGIGKSFFVSCIGNILGKNSFMEVNDPEHVVGRFGGHIKGKLLICADEGSFTSSKAAGKLKNMITAEVIALEEKYQRTITVVNHMRLMITGNDLQVITASRDERRYCVLDVSPTHKGDRAYWKKMHEWRDNGGLEALHHYLLHYPLEDVDLRTVPKTKALTDQKIASMDDVERWLLAVLFRGYIRQGPPWATPVPVSIIRASFAEFHGLKEMSELDSRIGRKLNEVFPPFKKSRNRAGDRQEYRYAFPSLDECRRMFEEYIGGEIDWPEPQW